MACSIDCKLMFLMGKLLENFKLTKLLRLDMNHLVYLPRWLLVYCHFSVISYEDGHKFA